jgi:hypothetical protein
MGPREPHSAHGTSIPEGSLPTMRGPQQPYKK